MTVAQRWVQRDGEGKIIGDFARPQKGYAEESIAEDSAELLEFRGTASSTLTTALTLENFVRLLIDKGVISDEDVAAATTNAQVSARAVR